MQVKDLNRKRVCDLSEDKKIAYIRRGDCWQIQIPYEPIIDHDPLSSVLTSSFNLIDYDPVD